MVWDRYQRRKARNLANAAAVVITVWPVIGVAAAMAVLVFAVLGVTAQQRADAFSTAPPCPAAGPFTGCRALVDATVLAHTERRVKRGTVTDVTLQTGGDAPSATQVITLNPGAPLPESPVPVVVWEHSITDFAVIGEMHQTSANPDTVLVHRTAAEAISAMLAVLGVRLGLWRRHFRRIAPRRYAVADPLLAALLIATVVNAVDPPDGYATAVLSTLILAVLALSGTVLPRLRWTQRKPPRQRSPLVRPPSSPPMVH